MVAGVSGQRKPPVPFFRGAECFTGQLPVHQVRLLGLIAIGLDADVLVFSDAFDFTQCFLEVVIVEIVQRGD